MRWAAAGILKLADGDDAVARDGDIGLEGGGAGAIDDFTASDQDIEHGSSLGYGFGS